jgi:hypothetical protein
VILEHAVLQVKKAEQFETALAQARRIIYDSFREVDDHRPLEVRN